ncbi:MAG: cupin domain-containing protein [Pseudobacteriovorax sp.]|nr:cupin domain-containing protein [Pseudobacteriovorax sp.]
MKEKSVNLKETFKKFDESWSPKVVAELNDYQFKVAWFEGEFVWHDHSETDEAFLVLEGHILIHLESETVSLSEGELYIVKKGLRHKPEAPVKSKVLLFEPKGVINTGNEQSDLQAENDIWI